MQFILVLILLSIIAPAVLLLRHKLRARPIPIRKGAAVARRDK